MNILTALSLLPYPVLIVLMVRLAVSLGRYKVKRSYTAAVSAPSVSICIPARNETHALSQCLERVLASDYAKMEVIVYDDGSEDNTSHLIRSFAYAGVRFVPGSELPEGWLGKNHALNVLANEASGTYVIFMDVDTYILPTTISQLVGYCLTEKVDMVSVIPGRNDVERASVLLGHLRYFWEMVVSNKRQPAASSAIWMVHRMALLEEFGGMESLKADVVPESTLARQLGTRRYHCLLNNNQLGVTYEKKWRSQMETSRRLLYARAGGTLVTGAVYACLLACINAPTALCVLALATGNWLLFAISAVLLAGFTGMYGMYLQKTWRSRWWLGVWLWPYVILQELVLICLSIIGYTTHTITWKGRPVMVARYAKEC